MKRLNSLLRIVLIVLVPFSGHAAISQPAGSINAGGTMTSSANYELLSVIGQSEPLDLSVSTNYRHEPGLLPVLGGLRILYPVVSVIPGIITFSLAGDATADRSVAIDNAGGSTLAWTVSKGDPAGTIFTVAPATGINSGAVNITANAAGLAAGIYEELLTIRGSGIEQTGRVRLSLTVTASSHQLQVTITSTVTGKGGGSVNSSPAGIACASGTCSANFTPGTTVTLYQSPDANSTWGSWSITACGTGKSCQVVMNGPQSITNTFNYAYLSKVNSTGSRFDSLAAAYGNAAASDTIYARDAVFAENLTLAGGKAINFNGGYDAYYNPLNAWTTLQGFLTVQSGTLTVDRLIIK